MIVPNIIIIWTGTIASIPSGFARCTELDGRFTKGSPASTNPNTQGGNATHSHTSPAHAHTLNSHTHAVTTTSDGSNQQSSDNSGTESYENPHYHKVNVGGISGGGLSSVTSTYASFSNNPPYKEVIYIKSTGYNFIPTNGIVFWNTSSVPSGFYFCDGANSTTDLRTSFLRGAASGQEIGAAGGSLTNIHPLIHTHTESTHSHSEVLGGIVTPSGIRMQVGSGFPGLGHTHTFVLTATTAGSVSNPADLTTAESVQPRHKVLLAIQNKTTPILPKSIIAMWIGTLASIPAGWNLCDGSLGTPDLREYYIKIATTTSDTLGDASATGSNTHTHAAQGHTHTGGSHTHTDGGSTLNHVSACAEVGGTTAVAIPSFPAPHAGLASIGNQTVSWASTNTTADESNHEPFNLTVAYLQYDYSVFGMPAVMI